MEVKISGKSLQFLSLYMFIFLSEYMKNGFGLSLSEADVIECIERERQALLKIKQELIDESGYLSSWGNEEYEKNCCEWRGISCSKQTGHVVSLNLSFIHVSAGTDQSCPMVYISDPVDDLHLERTRHVPLKGNISASLLELPHLNYLNLSSMDFGGQQIPEFIGSLNKLEHLDLSGADLGGRVPYQLKNLSRLQSLNLGSNFGLYAAKLEWLSGISSLKQLYLNDVNLSESTDWVQVISGLPSLTKLQLRDCNLPSVITSSISFVNSSKSLSFLDLFGNNLSNSKYLWLFHNSSSLAHLDLSNNNLRGSLPDAFCNMTSLSYLYLNENQIDSIPRCFSNMCALKELHLENNDITGQLSVLFSNFSGCRRDSLEILSLYNNLLSGSLPHFAPFLSIRRLDISKNQLNGTITKSIGQLSKLEYLDLSLNSLQGMITEAHLSNLSRLIYLDLSFNSLTLSFSTGWTPPFQLKQIALASCKQGPRFPKWLQSQHVVLSLDLSDAGISDTIPSWFWALDILAEFNLSNNQLSGFLPHLSNLYTGIDLSSNCFEGPLPIVPSFANYLLLSKNKFIGSISNICGDFYPFTHNVYLDISDNQLSGDIPDCLMGQKNLEVLNLANNNFSGKIPNSISYDCKIWALDLHNNSLIGELPSSLTNCMELTIMDAGSNKLFGTIPSWIGDSLPNLAILSLRSNQFYGNMPIQLCNLTKAQILDFSQNNITGTIPKCLNNLIALVQIESSNATIEYMVSSLPCSTYSYSHSYQGKIFLTWKRTYSEFSSILGLVKSIDFSSNRLSGNIPKEITSLVGLISLNLSRNSLIGSIPKEIGNLKRLDTLDLSENRLTGRIPESLLSQLDFLGVLDLSNNNLSGKIPLGSKSLTFTASSYLGNPNLCGFPLPKKCSGDEADIKTIITVSDNKEGFVTKGFYVSMVLGFIIGFWGVCGTLVLKESWRYAYFQFLNDTKDKLYILVAINMAKMQQNLRS